MATIFYSRHFVLTALMTKPWSRSTRYLVLILVLLVSVWFLYVSRALLGPLAISALLAFILNPAVTLAQERMKLGRAWVVLLVYLVSLVAIGLLGFVVVQIIAEQTTSLAGEIQAMLDEIRDSYLDRQLVIIGFPIHLEALILETAGQTTDLVSADVIMQAIQATTTNFGWILVVLVVTYYLLLDWARLREWVFRWTPAAYAGDGRRLYEEIKWVWWRYMRGQLRLSVIVGFLTTLGALIIGLPGAVVFGILSAVFNIIPSVGSTIVVVIAAAVALFTGSTTLTISNFLFMLLVIGVFSLVQLIENIWLRPRIMSSNLNIHPAVVFTAIIAALALAGVLTALIIVPAIASVGIIAKYIYFKLFELDPWENWGNEK
jgi:predicted PurR-regulated permease PerM